jgi:hypothetical protein
MGTEFGLSHSFCHEKNALRRFGLYEHSLMGRPFAFLLKSTEDLESIDDEFA